MQEGLKAVLERNGLVQTHLGESTCCWRAGFMDSTISSGLSLFVPNVIQRNIPSIGGYVFLELRREVWGGVRGWRYENRSRPHRCLHAKRRPSFNYPYSLVDR